MDKGLQVEVTEIRHYVSYENGNGKKIDSTTDHEDVAGAIKECTELLDKRPDLTQFEITGKIKYRILVIEVEADADLNESEGTSES